MKKDFTLNKLSAGFYEAFPEDAYSEIERKQSRPYVVLVIETEGERFALPLRTNIRHNCCYRFKNTGRCTESSTGIDFTKAVVISDEKYIGEPVSIDNKEYAELNDKFYFIRGKFRNYLLGYIKFCKEGGNDFVARKYRFTTLRYFKEELGIDK